MAQASPVPVATVSHPRARSFSRSCLLLLWTLVFWGTLLDLGALWTMFTHGVPRALEGLGNLSLLNVLCAAAALPVWVTVVWLAWLERGRSTD